MAAKKESKEKRREEEAAMAPSSSADDAVRSAKKAKKSKKEKSKKVRKRARRDSDADAAANAAPRAPQPPQEEQPSAPASDDKAVRKAARAAKKAAKSAAKSNLLERLPKVDADGIPYNKIQIRRMLRRVKHGLPPIATEEEEREIRMREKRERIEEEALYSATADDGDAWRGKEENEGEGAGLDGEDEENEPRGADGPEEVDDNDNDSSDHDEGGAAADDDDEPQKKTYRNPPPKKKAKRSKPVPPDYICQACHNRLDDFQPHWIYDCPKKKTQRGCNKVAKKLRGLHDPPSRKVFVSGLPFDCDEGTVKRYFEEGMAEKSGEGGEGGGAALGEDHELVHCKLLKFEDSKRCKGTGFLTFASDEGAKLALKLNGAAWREVEEPGTKSKKKKGKGKKGDAGGERKELRLKVSKVLNRRVTKQKQRGKN